MKDMNIAKLTSDDLPLFLGITGDLFPDVEVPTVDYEEIISYITKETAKLKLQVIWERKLKVVVNGTTSSFVDSSLFFFYSSLPQACPF